MKRNKNTTMKHQQAQQGDILLTRLQSIPEGGTPIAPQNGRLILAHGESGHSHTIEASEDTKLIQLGERMLLRLEKQATLTHEEHGPITLEPGVYEVGRVQEYDYLKRMARPVVD